MKRSSLLHLVVAGIGPVVLIAHVHMVVVHMTLFHLTHPLWVDLFFCLVHPL